MNSKPKGSPLTTLVEAARRIALLIFFILGTAGPVAAVTVGHGDVDAAAVLPIATLVSVGGQDWYFMHASVGANMVAGMEALALESPERYLLVCDAVGDVEPPPGDTGSGVIFENDRGNPGWATKLLWFEEAVRDLGWRDPAVNVVLNKLCYDDWNADPQAYVQSMAGLEAEFPATVFVYATMPITSNTNAANVQRALYNDAVRTYCAANGRLLFDIADIESHDPDGLPVTFTYEGQIYPRMYVGYTVDGGHLNAVGARRVALGWYATAAALAGDISGVGSLPTPATAIVGVFPNPFNPRTTVRLELARATDVDVAVFDARGRLVTRLFRGQLPAGSHDLVWQGTNAGGRSVVSGVYFVRLESGGRAVSRHLALVR